MTQTLYEILGIERNATQKDIKKAYRNSAMKYHPDKVGHVTPETEQMFQKIIDAYTVLSNDKTKGDYDDSLKLKDQEKYSRETMNQTRKDMIDRLERKESMSKQNDNLQPYRDNLRKALNSKNGEPDKMSFEEYEELILKSLRR